jgi:hypothetical protein
MVAQDRSVFDLKCSVALAKPSCAVQFDGIGAEKEIPDKTYEHIDNAG